MKINLLSYLRLELDKCIGYEEYLDKLDEFLYQLEDVRDSLIDSLDNYRGYNKRNKISTIKHDLAGKVIERHILNEEEKYGDFKSYWERGGEE